MCIRDSNYKSVDDFEVNITEHHPNEPQIWRVLLDEEFKAKLKIVKKDDETKKSVLIAGTEFKVYDLDNKKYVEQVTTYPVTTTHTVSYTHLDVYKRQHHFRRMHRLLSQQMQKELWMIGQ